MTELPLEMIIIIVFDHLLVHTLSLSLSLCALGRAGAILIILINWLSCTMRLAAQTGWPVTCFIYLQKVTIFLSCSNYKIVPLERT